YLAPPRRRSGPTAQARRPTREPASSPSSGPISRTKDPSARAARRTLALNAALSSSVPTARKVFSTSLRTQLEALRRLRNGEWQRPPDLTPPVPCTMALLCAMVHFRMVRTRDAHRQAFRSDRHVWL